MAQKPTARVHAALAAYTPGLPVWQQQRPAAELRQASAALAETITEVQARMNAQWDWLEANRDHRAYDEREEAWMALNDAYVAAYDLLGETEQAMKTERYCHE